MGKKAVLKKQILILHAAVSVVTKNGMSDDANGCNMIGNSVWLQICRVDNSYAFSLFRRWRNLLYEPDFLTCQDRKKLKWDYWHKHLREMEEFVPMKIFQLKKEQ